jgi:hypothetical protein
MRGNKVKINKPFMIILIGSLICMWGGAARAQEAPSKAKKETAATNFLQRGWYAERGVELPRPFGIGLNAVFMERDISVTDVTVKVGTFPEQSISDRFDFAVSSRIGWHRTIDRSQVRLWGGVAYIDAKRTLTIKTDLPVFGATTIEVDQEPADPVTYQIGGSLSLNRRWDLLVEAGSNFDDARLLVLSASFRF